MNTTGRAGENGSNDSGLMARLDRLESLESIRQLAHRYAHAVDTRDFDGVGALYIETVEVHRSGADGGMRVEIGRDALKSCEATSLSIIIMNRPKQSHPIAFL